MDVLPYVIKLKIMSYLPIFNYERDKLNKSIRATYKMNKIVEKFALYFNTEGTLPSSAIIACSICWVYNDLSDFLNNSVPVTTNIEQKYRDFLYRLTNTNITNSIELRLFEETYTSIQNLVIDHAIHMTTSEFSDFWQYCMRVYNMPFLDLNE